MVRSTTGRVVAHTAECVNENIREVTEANVRRSVAAGGTAIDERIAELDREWDIERALEANAAVVSLAGVVMGVAVNRKWFALPAIVAGFLLQHAIDGWCPPVPLWRRLGFRTQSEIERERYALKVLRGDFRGLPAGKGCAALDELMKAVAL